MSNTQDKNNKLMAKAVSTIKDKITADDLNPNMPLHDKNSIMKLWAVITSGKSYGYVLDYIQNELQESVRMVEFHYEMECFFADGAYALSRAIEGKIGFSKQQSEKDISGENPPKMINVSFADGTSIKVPFGKIDLPNFGDGAYIDMKYKKETQMLSIKGTCQKRFQADLDDIHRTAVEFLKFNSIYKGQAIKYDSSTTDPIFINLGDIDRKKLYLTPEAKFATQPIEARIERTEECIANGIDIKFGTMLEGSYGL